MSEQAYERLAALVPETEGSPVLVGITGAVAVGKSTVASMLSDAVGPRSATVMSGDGFLMPNAELVARDAWLRKGHPDTYDVEAFATALREVRAGRPATVPVYSHLVYDRVPDEHVLVEPRDVVIIEGLHLLHDDFRRVTSEIDLTVYVDADAAHLRVWYEERLRGVVEEAHRTPGSFELYRNLPLDQVSAFAETTWTTVNVPNIETFIAPTRERADVVLEKGDAHTIVDVRVREA